MALIRILVAFLLLFITIGKAAGQDTVSVTPNRNDTIRLEPVPSSPQYFIVDLIIIQGNHKTRESIIRRELDFTEGDSIPVGKEGDERLQWNRNRIFNTGLFVTVDIKVTHKSGDHYEITIQLKERFYTYPLPILELADRNFNEWWEQRNRDIHRINVGADFVQKNIRGRNETLRLKLQFGFTHKYELTYNIPYLTKKQNIGMTYWLSYSTNKQLAYTIDNHTLTYTELMDEKMRERFYTAIAFNYRDKFYEKHTLTLGYFNNNINDTIAKLNPYYFLDGRTRQEFFAARYTFVRDRRDQMYYPYKGYYVRGDIEGLGLSKQVNILNLRAEYAHYVALSKKFFLATGFRQKVSFPELQPFYNFTAFGYNLDYVSGYELYVINGQHLSLGKVNFKYKIFETRKELEQLPYRQFNTIPITILLKLHFDAGYVWDNTTYKINPYANKFLGGAGAGIDFVTFYDMVFRVEYSYNLEKEGGVFLHMRAGI